MTKVVSRGKVKPNYYIILLALISLIYLLFSCGAASQSEVSNKFSQNIPIPGGPVIRYTSAKNGPVSGWEGSTTRGAAITIWAENIGASRGSGTLTVCGVTLDEDSDYAEWGANTQPKTAKNTRRITFWLNSQMSGSGGIYITVNGVRSNVYPFTCDTTGNIRFVDYQNGSDSSNGKTSARAWKTLNYAADQMEPGDFVYLRGGVYSEARFNIGYWSVATDWYPGTDMERITMTSYPGEEAVIRTMISAHSSYWTFARITFDGPGNNFYGPLALGDRNGYRAGSPHGISEGLMSVGNEFRGTMWLAMEAYGNNITIQGNYVKFTPDPNTPSGHAYSLYMCSGLNRVIKDNEIYGGATWLIHYFDENRVGASYKEVSGVIEGNWLDATNNGGIGLRGALIVQFTDNGVTINLISMVIRNNIFFTRDSGLTDGFEMIRLGGWSSISHAENIKIYNNIFYKVNNSAAISLTPYNVENVEIKNNIFSSVNGYAVDVGGNPQSITVANNLYDNTPNLNNITDSSPIVGDPRFVNPAGYDFHLEPTSPAIDKGLLLETVNRDYEYNPRPLDGDNSGTPEYDVGAFEYTD